MSWLRKRYNITARGAQGRQTDWLFFSTCSLATQAAKGFPAYFTKKMAGKYAFLWMTPMA